MSLPENTTLNWGPWYRKSPFFEATLRAGCSAYDVYQHMYHPNTSTPVLLRVEELAEPGTRLDVETDDGTRVGTTATLPFIDPNKKVPAA